jgi:hypothetical protein
MGVNNVDQGFGDIRKIVVYFFVDPAADKGEGFNQPFGVGVFTLIAFKQQRVLSCKVVKAISRISLAGMLHRGKNKGVVQTHRFCSFSL